MLYRKGQSSDSSVLSHPMLWLDERIFGWSRSASVGASVWGQPGSTGRAGRSRSISTRSVSSSGPASPEGSDYEYDDVEEEEADVDYDDVLAITDVRRSTGRSSGDGDGNWGDAQAEGDELRQTSPGGSPRRGGGRGRSYRDLKAVRGAMGAGGEVGAAAGAGTGAGSGEEAAGDVPEPRRDDGGRERLRLRKRGEGEGGSGAGAGDALGLDNGRGKDE